MSFRLQRYCEVVVIRYNILWNYYLITRFYFIFCGKRISFSFKLWKFFFYFSEKYFWKKEKGKKKKTVVSRPWNSGNSVTSPCEFVCKNISVEIIKKGKRSRVCGILIVWWKGNEIFGFMNYLSYFFCWSLMAAFGILRWESLTH